MPQKQIDDMDRDELMWLVLELHNKLLINDSKDVLINKLQSEKNELELKVQKLTNDLDAYRNPYRNFVNPLAKIP